MDKDRNKKKKVTDLHIGNKFELQPDQKVHYGNVLIAGDGYFYMTGGNHLEIDCLKVEKEAYHKKYAILIQGPDGEEGKDAKDINATNIIIHRLVNSVHIKSTGGNGGTGGKGTDGNPGGDGGDLRRMRRHRRGRRYRRHRRKRWSERRRSDAGGGRQ